MTPELIEHYATAIADAGVIYALRDDLSGHVKIGHSTDVLRRISQIQTGNGHGLRQIALLVAQQWQEHALHRFFSNRRIRGEWFDDQDGEVSRILQELGKRYGEGVTWSADRMLSHRADYTICYLESPWIRS